MVVERVVLVMVFERVEVVVRVVVEVVAVNVVVVVRVEVVVRVVVVGEIDIVVMPDPSPTKSFPQPPPKIKKALLSKTARTWTRPSWTSTVRLNLPKIIV